MNQQELLFHAERNTVNIYFLNSVNTLGQTCEFITALNDDMASLSISSMSNHCFVSLWHINEHFKLS